MASKGVLPLAGRQPKFSSTGGVCRSPKRATIGGLPRGSGLANIAMDEETSAMQPLGVLNGKKALRGAESYEGEWLAAVETLRPHSRVRIRVGKTMYSVRVHDTVASYEYTFPILPTGLSSDSALESSSGSHVHLASASMLWFASTSAEWNQGFSEVCRMEPTYQAIARLFRLPNMP
ncbi:hypothetical protein TrVFT333_001652 [Trichoderma virens FT-333]|nr:hypothetical protein TrVFT333_001652 [Trichoderma virens FT-333]